MAPGVPETREKRHGRGPGTGTTLNGRGWRGHGRAGKDKHAPGSLGMAPRGPGAARKVIQELGEQTPGPALTNRRGRQAVDGTGGRKWMYV